MTAFVPAGSGGITSPRRSPVEWVVFDYGEVFSLHTDVRPRLARMMGVPLADFCEAWAAERDSYDVGQPDLNYWRAVGARLGTPVDEDLCARLTAVDVSGWNRVRPEAVAVVEELAAQHTPLALLSNAPHSHARVFRQQAWAAHFRHLLFSGEIGTAKPDPNVWKPLLDLLGAPPSALLFFDDRQENVDSALAAGIRAALWTGVEPARSLLADLHVLPEEAPVSPAECADAGCR